MPDNQERSQEATLNGVSPALWANRSGGQLENRARRRKSPESVFIPRGNNTATGNDIIIAFNK